MTILSQPLKEDLCAYGFLQISKCASIVYFLLDVTPICRDYQYGYITALGNVFDELTGMFKRHLTALIGIVENEAGGMMLNELKSLSTSVDSLRNQTSPKARAPSRMDARLPVESTMSTVAADI